MASERASTAHLHIFGDETTHTGPDPFLVYGTVHCRRENLPKILAELEKAARNNSAELKWSGKHYRERLPGFVEAIFRCRDRYDLGFRCIVVNKRHSDHGSFNDNDPNLGLEKYIFLNLLRYARTWKGDHAQFHVLLDKRSNKPLGETQTRALNSRDDAERGRGYPIFANVLDVESTSSRLIQAADVLSGAIGWVWNQRYNDPKASADKRELVKLIARRARIGIMGQAEAAGVERLHFMTLA